MGFTTDISIQNDAWHALRETPEALVEAIDQGMNARQADTYGFKTKSGSVYVNYITVHPSHHADDPRVYLSYQNSLRSMSKYDIEAEFGERLNDPDDFIHDVLEREVAIAEEMLSDLRRFLEEKRKA